MNTIIRSNEREYKENPDRIDTFRLFTDITRLKKGINPENLNFDLRKLNPGEYSSPYHFHRNSEELFVVMEGSITLRTPNGLEILSEGDIAFFKKGKEGAHQLYNHTTKPSVYLDIRTFMGNDICEYPDSNKLATIPEMEIFDKNSNLDYFDGEKNVIQKWEEIKNKE